MAREYWMDRDGMNMPPKKTAVSVVDIGTEGLAAREYSQKREELTTQAAYETNINEYCKIMREIESTGPQ